MNDKALERLLNDDKALQDMIDSMHVLNDFVAKPCYYQDNRTPEDAA